ncbi:helix-turn-helix domain-containing protein [Paludicola sp. MB14-C6]|uniref:helix-turn-helix domain-containing protein n=1 Tax=Paludihabitans sp. MB14-C6 TaxID=3070656 RepID=UPI0027DDBB8E|nr:helix-turn-helix domain-containing protein [Paludicola sp. MB14-C6]WMJ22195.1 helix-turn-helix domain-containing protein [Paludicola sp. MB14-C6]
MSIKTVQSALKELQERFFIQKEHCYKNKQYITNRYKIIYLTKNRWFKLDPYIFKTNIKSTDFVIYCYIISRMKETCKEAFPSYSTISKSTGISRVGSERDG